MVGAACILKGAASYQLFNSAQRKQERTKNYLDELREFKKDDKDLEEFIDKMKGKILILNRYNFL